MERNLMDDEISTTSSDDNRPANIHVFASSSTLHGFSHIFARHHSSLRRFAWTVAFLSSFTLLLFQSSNRAVYYLGYPHVTRLDEVAAGNLSFPAITICNLNEFRYSKITKNDIYHVGRLLGFLDSDDKLLEPRFYKYFNQMEPSVRERLSGQKEWIETITDFSRDFTAQGNFNMHEFYNRTGHDLKEYLLTCKYRGMMCNHTWFSESVSSPIHWYRMETANFSSSAMLGAMVIPTTTKPSAVISTSNEGKASLNLPKDEISSIPSPRLLNNVTSNLTYQENGMRMRRKVGGSGNKLSDVMMAETFPISDDMDNKSEAEETKAKREARPSDFTFFAGNSTLHGMSHIFTDGRWTLRRLLWGVAFFTSLTLFLHQAHNRYSYFISNPHVTKLDELEANIMAFPAITVCNMNAFRLSKVTTDDYFFVGEAIFDIFDGSFNLQAPFRDTRTWPTVYEKIKPILSQRGDFLPSVRTFDMFEFYNRTGHDISNMVLRCSYSGFDCTSTKDWKAVFTRYGKCYTFNSGEKYEALTTLKGGVDNGLEILLDTQQDEYMPVWDETDEISVEAGFKVQIHVQSEPPFIHELGFGISPGFQTLVATQEQRFTFLPKPWGDCVEKSEKGLSFPFLYKNYSISACRISCETKWVWDNCSCRMIHMPKPANKSARYCDPEQYKNCADRALNYLMETDESVCLCKTPCEVIRYNVQTSSLMLPSTQAASYLAWRYNVSERYVRDNFVKLNIFFEALNYETIDQKVAYEVAGLLGDIGGQMGLFIGASILTILELFDYVYEFIKDKTWGRTLRKAKRDVEQQASIAATTSLLIEKSEKDGASGILPPSAQYHAVPGTVSMAFHNQRSNHYNGINSGGMATRHGPPVLTTLPHPCINHSKSLPYSTMPYKSPMIYPGNHDAYRPQRYTEEPMPPPPPQYLGQSMMTLRGDCGVPEMALTKRHNGGEGRHRETSVSYNDLLHLDDNGQNVTEDDDDVDYPPRHNHIAQLAAYSAGLATLPHFRPHSFIPLTGNDDYSDHGYRPSYNYIDEFRPRCTTPTKMDYSKTLETDIH